MNDLSNGMLVNSKLDELVERIQASVRRRVGGWVRDFQVQVQDQGLVLRGRTRTYYAKQLVQHTAMEVGGLPILANRVEVL
jgi:osmotically-inducible protein OsmY